MVEGRKSFEKLDETSLPAGLPYNRQQKRRHDDERYWFFIETFVLMLTLGQIRIGLG